MMKLSGFSKALRIADLKDLFQPSNSICCYVSDLSQILTSPTLEALTFIKVYSSGDDDLKLQMEILG